MDTGYSVRELEKILDSIPQHIAYRDLDGRYIYCNESYSNMFNNSTKNENIGKMYNDLNILQKDINFIEDKDKDVIKNKQNIEYSQIVYTNKEKHILEINKLPFFNENNELHGVLTIINNISYKEELSKLREGFFSNIKHEFMTPINMILASTQHLLKRCENCNVTTCNDCIVNNLHIINSNTLRILKLSNNFIDLTNIKSGGIELNLQNYDIISAIEDMCIEINSYKNFKNIDLIFDTEVEERIVTFDKLKLERILLNLISNAIKFSHEGGQVYVSISLENEYVKISVKDTGIGIKPENIQMIFNEFANVENRLTKMSEGCGVGLALTKHLVDMHQGKIHVNSETGNGSEFIVLIPDQVHDNISNSEILNKIYDNRIDRIKMELSDIYD